VSFWKRVGIEGIGIDVFVFLFEGLDGSTAAQDREKLINEFNSNANVLLFLVSTRAGSLGKNKDG
jgi:SNF2 family DNA or RNA helicase